MTARRFDSTGAALGAEFTIDANVEGVTSIWASLGLSNNIITAINRSGSIEIGYIDYDAGSGNANLPYRTATEGVTPNVTPKIAIRNDGSFLVYWAANNTVYARLYDATRGPQTAVFQVNAGVQHINYVHASAMDDDSFIMVWNDSVGSAGEYYVSNIDCTGSTCPVTMRRISSDGVPTGDEFTVTSTGILPSTVNLPGRGFAVTWTEMANSVSGGDFRPGADISAQIYDISGTAQGAPIRVNVTSGAGDYHGGGGVSASSSIAATHGGEGIAFTWMSYQGGGPLGRRMYSRNFEFGALDANEFSILTVLANDTDADNDPLTITAVNGTPTAGPVFLPSGAFVSLGSDLDYDPTSAPFAIALPEGVTGNDSFTYTISDGALTDTATVNVIITGVNDPPVPDNDAIFVLEDEAAVDITALLLDGDTDPDTGETAQLVISGLTSEQTTVGTTTFNNGQITYAAEPGLRWLTEGEVVSEQVFYDVRDPSGATASAYGVVQVTGQNDAPTADNDTLTFAEEEGARTVTATLLNGDTDPDLSETEQLTITAIGTSGTQGLVTLEDGRVRYSPNGAFNHLAQGQTATDGFSYTVSDPEGATDTGNVVVTINGFNGYQLTVTTSGLGTGTVTSLPLGLNCGGGGGCTALFTQNSEVALSALVAPGTTFEGWGGDCLDPAQPLCVVRMAENRSVSARFSLTTVPPGRIVAATLPGARSGYVGGGDITVFMTVLSRATTPAQACRITAPNDPPFTLTYRQVNAQNEVIGDANPLFDLGNGGAINFVIALTPTRTTDQSGYVFLPRIQCENADLSPIEGVNSVLVSIGAAPVPDILSIGATPSADGVVRIPASCNRINFLSAAALNIGAGDGSAGANEATVTASVDTGAASLPLTLEVCETAPTGGCITPRGETQVSTVFAQNVAKFFAVFVRANGEATVPFDPANARVFLRFADASGTIRSATSAAVSAPAAASDQPALQSAMPVGRWSVLVRQGGGEWPSLVRASLFVLEDGTAILDDGTDVTRLAFEGFVAEDDIGRFETRNTGGLWTGEGNIQAGPLLSNQPGDLWGVRDARSDMAPGWDALAGQYGEGMRIDADGSISGTIGDCIVSGRMAPGMEAASGMRIATVSLMSCESSGEYRAVMDVPANDSAPALLLSGSGQGWRIERQ